jgi:(p)ppGpp synthase/HD superfamily hydrolase
LNEPCYGPRFEDALILAAQSFASVRRKATGVPYLAHLLWVTATVAEHHGDEDQLIAALLHDYLEDVEGSSSAQLEARYGPRVAWLVRELSDTTVRPKPPWRERKERYLAHLPGASPEVKLISAADKLHNVRSCVQDYQTDGEALFDRFRGGREGTLWYFREVNRALGQGWPHPIMHELGEQVALLHRLASAPFSDA